VNDFGDEHIRDETPRAACPWCAAPRTSDDPTLPCSHCGRSPETAPTTSDPVTSGAPPIAPPLGHTAHLICLCGYDLTGSLIGGNCPECGRRIAESLGPRDPRVQGRAVAAVVLACCAVPLLCSCGPFGLPLSVTGLIMGIQLIRSPKPLASPDRVLALVSIVVGAIGSLIGLAFTVVMLIAFFG